MKSNPSILQYGDFPDYKPFSPDSKQAKWLKSKKKKVEVLRGAVRSG
jgi:hypothetical protein